MVLPWQNPSCQAIKIINLWLLVLKAFWVLTSVPRVVSSCKIVLNSQCFITLPHCLKTHRSIKTSHSHSKVTAKLTDPGTFSGMELNLSFHFHSTNKGRSLKATDVSFRHSWFGDCSYRVKGEGIPSFLPWAAPSMQHSLPFKITYFQPFLKIHG